jgi:hypothetical protein
MAVRCASDLRRFETLVSTRGNRRLETTRGAAVMDEHQVRRSTARASGLPNASEREPALQQRAWTSSGAQLLWDRRATTGFGAMRA